MSRRKSAVKRPVLPDARRTAMGRVKMLLIDVYKIPVAVSLGKTVTNGWGGYECCWARTLAVVAVIEKLTKQRKDSVAQYEAAGRNELAASALQRMEEFSITSLFVFDDDQSRQPVGVVHLHDLLKAGIA